MNRSSSKGSFFCENLTGATAQLHVTKVDHSCKAGGWMLLLCCRGAEVRQLTPCVYNQEQQETGAIFLVHTLKLPFKDYTKT